MAKNRYVPPILPAASQELFLIKNMNINIKATDIDLTSTLTDYINEKIGDLDKFIGKMEKKGEIEVFIEVGRSTKHHYKGEVFFAKGDFNLPEKSAIVESTAETVYAAIDLLKDKLRREIEKYRDQKDL
ncbi:ribosome-associated translation inhibitor RaiA [Patescibacteria group bacterium]|nr:ribosome-associated translation inhibitor RaiA [Patescibacteria group bacterium]